MKKSAILLLSIVTLLALAACGGGNGGSSALVDTRPLITSSSFVPKSPEAVLFWYGEHGTPQPELTTSALDTIDFNGFDKLMIVAHPDDEVLWGGRLLVQEEGWFVVCLTSGVNQDEREIRSKEFEALINATHNKALMLGYPDEYSEIWIESGDIEQMAKDLRLILEYKNWTTVATHGPRGETAHLQHMQTSKTTLEVVNRLNMKYKLWYFTIHDSSPESDNSYPDSSIQPTIHDTESRVEIVQLIIDCYPSQVGPPYFVLTDWIFFNIVYQDITPALGAPELHDFISEPGESDNQEAIPEPGEPD